MDRQEGCWQMIKVNGIVAQQVIVAATCHHLAVARGQVRMSAAIGCTQYRDLPDGSTTAVNAHTEVTGGNQHQQHGRKDPDGTENFHWYTKIRKPLGPVLYFEPKSFQNFPSGKAGRIRRKVVP